MWPDQPHRIANVSRLSDCEGEMTGLLGSPKGTEVEFNDPKSTGYIQLNAISFWSETFHGKIQRKILAQWSIEFQY